MEKINFPEPGFRTKREEGKDFIFDPLRKKWIILTPEEWVRQNFVQYLVKVKGYPAAYIAIEKEIRVGELKKRFDILVYNNNHQPWMLIECKAPEINLDENTLHQVLRYNIAVPANHILVTNGTATFSWKKENEKLVLANEVPAWE
ncbi:MAG TPA: type I restriction enzyme HsdR N-terminal domain-containing protein [Chitinophagaceae bacterium]|nr:type I restriction enzyme HsdR N-terminal domain-containing protein [Chitinophagaceae bacterium]